MANDPVNPNNEPNNTPDVASLEAKIKELEKDNAALRKTNTEASADASRHKHEKEELKKQLDARMTEEEKAKAAQAEAEAALHQRIAELEAKERTATLVSIGFETDTAEEFATAFKDNNFDGLVEGIRKFIDTHDKGIKDSNIQNNPTIKSNGNTGKAMTREEILAVRDPIERQKLIGENLELFTE